MNVFFEETYHINTCDIDLFGHCRPSAILRYLQEASTGAALSGDFSREQLIQNYNAFWMLARIWYRLERPIHWDQELMVRTWHRGNQGLIMYRDYNLYLNGAYIGEAVGTWVLADYDTRKLLRMSSIEELRSSHGGTLRKDTTLQKLRIPHDLPLAEERMLHYSDTDINGHVNNSRYADFACDAIGLSEAGKGKYVSELQVGYLTECRANESLLLHTGEEDGQWYIHGLDKDAKPRFDAAITLLPLDNVKVIT